MFRRPIQFCVLLVLGLIFANAASASDPRLKKVLPQLIDTKERSSLSPSLYERDAYQAFLRAHSGERGGIRFAVLWHGSSKGKDLRLRVEMRGLRNEATLIKTLEVPVAKAGWFNTWTYLDLRGQEYKNFGELAAWRVTLWDGTRQLSEQKSFLW